jgi:UDP-N-acetyl-D-mannosaminuronic acid dehydrogenase
MAQLYHEIVIADLDCTDIVTAELTKTTENAYRDVQIAFANEVARICEVTGADVWRVRELVNKSPGRQMLLPGAGVGGHCIPKDPWLLAHAADGHFEPILIPAAREVNSSMPGHMITLLEEGLAEVGLRIHDAVIAVLGYAYLEESDDTRNSPSEEFVRLLSALSSEVRIHDPWVKEYQGDLLDLIEGSDAVVIMVAHHHYRQMDLNKVLARMNHPVVVDGRHVIDTDQAFEKELIYRCVGIGHEGH